MDERTLLADRPLPDRYHEPADCRRSVAVESALHAGFLEDSEQSRTKVDSIALSPSNSRLGYSDSANATESQCECQAAIRDADLGALGRATSQTFVSVQEAKRSLDRLRPSELTRLLNSTPLGTVITERQLYRHREVAGRRIGEQRWIDLVRYTAWLVEERHEPQSTTRKSKTQSPASDKITKQGVLKLLEQQSYRCFLTGWELTPHNASLDHRLPVSRGGAHTISNAQALHEDVNRAKGTLTNEEFIELCRAVVRQADQKQQPQSISKDTP